ncbi:MAG TPA: type IV pilus assembly protein PilM [Candidatus Saccharimonadales bacterium]|nr:type IV pilus assembly protein PilM [Candidatus Saccharimonadales bacterium]
MGILSRDSDYFGLDIGETAIRIVQLRRSGSKPSLVSYGDAPLSVGAVRSDSTADVGKLGQAVAQLVKDLRLTTKNVVAGLPASKVFASIITTPKLSEAELAKAIPLQADQYIPMPIDQVKVDWSVLGPGVTENELEVLLVAAPKTITDKYLRILETAGLEVMALEINSTALYRALVPPTSPAVLVLDMGSIASDLAIIHEHSPRLIRSISVGGQTLVKAASQSLGLDDAQAEQFVHKFGLTQTKLEGQVFKAIKPSLDILIEEVQKSIKFFTGRYPQAKLEKLVLTGGTSSLLELPTYIATAIGLPVEIGNAWINVSYPASLQEKLITVSSHYGVASGLAQRNFVE